MISERAGSAGECAAAGGAAEAGGPGVLCASDGRHNL